MKKLLAVTAIFVLILISRHQAWGVDNDRNFDDFKTCELIHGGNVCGYVLSETGVSMSNTGGLRMVHVGTRDGCTWSAESKAGWIHVDTQVVTDDPTVGSGNVWFTVSEYGAPDTRQGVVRIACQDYTVSQSGTDCSFTLSETASTFTLNGGHGTVAVSTASHCSWIATSNTSWITIESGATGTGKGTVIFAVAGNTGLTTRVGTFVAGNVVYTVTQTVNPCSYTFTPSSATFDSNLSVSSVAIDTKADCPWTATASSNWLHLDQTGGRGPGMLSYTVDRNTAMSSRNGTISIGAVSFPIGQSGALQTSAVYRFLDKESESRFYTASVQEKNLVQQSYPFYFYEGIAFYAYSTAQAGTMPVFRFNDTASLSHFYTISTEEKTRIMSTMPAYLYEGVAFYAFDRQVQGTKPVYRFFNKAKGFHFYTMSEDEKNLYLNMPDYLYDGIVFYCYQ